MLLNLGGNVHQRTRRAAGSRIIESLRKHL